MSIKEQLQHDMAVAMREGNKTRKDALRLLLAAIKQTEIDGRITLDDAGVQGVLTKQAKQRRESIADYDKAGRADLVAGEQLELTIIESYLPRLMSREEIRALASAAIAETDVTDTKGMGQVMSRLMPQVKGKADGRLVNDVVRELLVRG